MVLVHLLLMHLSTWTEVTIQRDGGIYQMRFERGKTVEPLTRIGDSKENRNKS